MELTFTRHGERLRVRAVPLAKTNDSPAFKRALGLLGLRGEDLDRIEVVAAVDHALVRRAVAQASAVYVSPLCDREARALEIPPERLLSFTRHLADESIEELEAWLLLSAGHGTPLRGWPA